MNFFAHGIASLDRPWVVAGTALPDWLRVADRRARVREGDPERWPGAEGRDLAEGVRRHLDEDRLFHAASPFVDLCSRVTQDLRRLPANPRFRASVVAHVLVEMVLDAWLDREHPGALLRYYEVLGQVPEDELATVVSASHGPEIGAKLGATFDRFRRSRFLVDYAEDAGLLGSLARVAERVRLGALPEALPDRLPDYRSWVAGEARSLMREVRA